MNPIRSTLLLVLLFFFGFLVGCNGSDKAPAPPGPTTIDVSTPIADTLTDYAVFTGRTQAINAAELRARVTGYLQEAPFRQGDDVKKGDRLFIIQQRPFEEAVRQAKATRDQQKAQLNYQELLFQRDKALLAKGALSSQDFQQVVAGRDGAKSSLEAAEAALAIAEQNLEWSVVRAPFSGRISRRLVDPGNDVIADNTILASLVEIDKLYAYFDVDERTLLRISGFLPQGKVPTEAALAFPLKLGLANEKPEDFSYDGTLTIADNKVDASTGTLRMWGTFDNPRRDLKPGLFVRVRMGIGKPRPSLFVAEAALGSDQGRKFLYVVNAENKVVYTPVTVGQRHNGMIAIESGLKGDEQIVIKGLQRIRPQMEVVPNVVPMPRVSAAALPVGGFEAGKAAAVPAPTFTK